MNNVTEVDISVQFVKVWDVAFVQPGGHKQGSG